jgi:septum site-determining protein MinC
VGIEALSLPKVRVRGRSFLALIVAPEAPFAEWFAALDEQMRTAAEFFAERPVVADLSAVIEVIEDKRTALVVLDGLEARNLRLIGVEGIDPILLAGTRWASLPTVLSGREREMTAPPAALDAADEPAPPLAAPVASLLIDRPVRSGQTIVYDDGDVIVVGSVASGAEVIAGGSIHVYGALRGRALAGLRQGDGARIFCRKLEAEMVAVGQLYRTAEHWGAELHGRAVQVVSDRGTLRLAALD